MSTSGRLTGKKALITGSVTSSAAAAIVPARRAAMRSSVTMRLPRDVFTRRAPGFIRAMLRALIIDRV